MYVFMANRISIFAPIPRYLNKIGFRGRKTSGDIPATALKDNLNAVILDNDNNIILDNI